MNPAFASVFGVALVRRLRKGRTYVLLLLITALAAALVPADTASYSVINVGKSPLSMSADTALLAAASVMNVFVLMIYALALDVGHHRDRTIRSHLHASLAPISPVLVLSARTLANAAFLLLALAVAAVILSTTIIARYDALPSGFGLFAFFASVLPVIVLTVLAGLCLDALMPANAIGRSVALFSLVLAAIILSITSVVDILGFDFLRTAIGGERANEISVGFISRADAIKMSEWRSLASETGAAGYRRAGLVAVLALPFLVALPLAAMQFVRERPVVHSPSQLHAVSADEPGLAPSAADFALASGQTAGIVGAAWIILARYLRRTKASLLLLILCFVLGLAGVTPALCLSAAYLALMLLFSQTLMVETRMSSTYEACEPALIAPKSGLFTLACLLAITLFAASSTLVRLPAIQALTAGAGLVFAAAWLDATHRREAQPVLGAVVLGGIFYIVAFNDLPPPTDILGFWQADITAMLVAIGLAIASLAVFATRYK